MHVELNVNENDPTKLRKLLANQFGRLARVSYFLYISSGSFWVWLPNRADMNHLHR